MAGLAVAPLMTGKALGAFGQFHGNTGPELGATSAGLPRYQSASAAFFSGQILVSGGYALSAAVRQTLNTLPTASAQLFDAQSGHWFDIAPMNQPRARHTSALLWDGRVVVVGGYSLSPLDSIEAYDPRSGRWEQIAKLPVPMADISVAVYGSQLFVTGGGNACQVIDYSTRFAPGP